MKIVVIARSKNEAHCVEKFCEAYAWADSILIADDASEDSTVLLANQFSNVTVTHFSDPVKIDDGVRTSEGKQINFLIRWAKKAKADWIILDDIDSTPNYLLKEKARQILEVYFGDYVLVTKLFIWMDELHFPALAKPRDNDWTPGLWAWRGELDFWAKEADPYHYGFRVDFEKSGKLLRLYPPFCVLHNPWPTDEILQKKLDFYQSIGMDIQHPLAWAGILQPLPEWGRE